MSKETLIQFEHNYDIQQNQEALKNFIEDNMNTFLEFIHQKNHIKMVDEFMKMLYLSQIQNSFSHFCRILLITTEYCIEYGLYNQAVFLNSQQLKLTDFTHNLKMRMEILLSLSECAKKFKDYSIGVQFAARSLQFSWYLKENEFQWKCYDQLGQLFYYLGDVEKSIFFHSRYSNGQNQTSGFITNQAQECVEYYLRQNPYEINQFCYKLLANLQLPFKNIFSQRNFHTLEFEEAKENKFKTCNGLQILKDIVNQTEFQLFILDIDYLLKPDMEKFNNGDCKTLSMDLMRQRKQQNTNKIEIKRVKKPDLFVSLNQTLKNVRQRVFSQRPIPGMQEKTSKVFLSHLKQKEILINNGYEQRFMEQLMELIK